MQSLVQTLCLVTQIAPSKNFRYTYCNEIDLSYFKISRIKNVFREYANILSTDLLACKKKEDITSNFFTHMNLNHGSNGSFKVVPFRFWCVENFNRMGSTRHIHQRCIVKVELQDKETDLKSYSSWNFYEGIIRTRNLITHTNWDFFREPHKLLNLLGRGAKRFPYQIIPTEIWTASETVKPTA